MVELGEVVRRLERVEGVGADHGVVVVVVVIQVLVEEVVEEVGT